MSAPPVSAEWMDGTSAESRPALLVISAGQLVISTPDGREIYARWPLERIRIDAIHEGGAMHIECEADPEAHVLTHDVGIVNQLAQQGSKVAALPGGRRRWVVGLGSAFAVAGLLAGFYFAAPWLSARLARLVPVDVERTVAPEVRALFRKQTCETAESRVAIDRMLRRLDPDGEIQAEVRIVNLDLPNAFALPGSIVVLTKGLIRNSSGPDEVVGVLAHELAHVKHRHVMAQMIRNAFMGAVWAVTLGDYSGLLIVDPDTAYGIATLRHSREAESEADATALEMMRERGISPQGLINFFERHKFDTEDDTAWLSTHPASGDRVDSLTFSEPEGPTKPTLDAESYFQLRRACAGTPGVESIRDLFF